MSTGQRPISKRARERLIESHMPLVRAVARRYAGRGADLDDLVQVGAIGLIKATDRFDPSRGKAFAAFAAPTIEGEIRHHLRDRAAAVRIPRDVQQLAGELRRRRDDLVASLGRAPTIGELADTVRADEREVERALHAAQTTNQVASLVVGESSAATNAGEPFAASDDRLLLADGMRALDERDRRIVYLRFHADKTEREIAREVGLSQAQISRRLAGALVRLRSGLSADQPGSGRGDTTRQGVISPGPGAPPPPAARAAGGARMAEVETTPGFGPRIDAVTGPRSDSTAAKQLDLPYHVAVRAEGDDAISSWVAVVEELPGCTARGQTPEAAIERLRAAMEIWLTAAVAETRENPAHSSAAPKPRPASGHSGRFLVRMPSELHEQLAQAAERRQVSLNRLVTELLAASLRDGVPARPAGGDRPDPLELGDETGPRGGARTLRLALAANLVVVVIAGAIAVALLVLALQRGI